MTGCFNVFPMRLFLPAHTGNGVSLLYSIFLRTGQIKGIYYEAEGTIYTPVILSTQSSMEAVMKEE